MSTTEIALELPFTSIESEYQALMITVPNDYKEPVSPQSSFSNFSQPTAPFIEVKNSLQSFTEYLKDEMDI